MFRITDQDWAKSLEEGVVVHTDALIEQAYADENDETADVSSNPLSGEVFCGCDTCFWREALFFLVPRIIEGYKTGKIVVDE